MMLILKYTDHNALNVYSALEDSGINTEILELFVLVLQPRGWLSLVPFQEVL